MMTIRDNQTIKAILLLAGSFTFAFLLGEFIHDSGHYLSHLAYGNDQVQVHFDPFGGTRIIGANGLPDRVLAVTSATGPLPHLVLALTSFALLWRIRRPILLPLLLWGPVAMIQEGVTFSLGLLTPGGDARWIATLGIPQPVILLFGFLLLIAGTGAVAKLLPIAGIKQDDSLIHKLVIILAGMGTLMLVRAIHTFWFHPEALGENFFPLILSLLLASIVAMMHRPLTKRAKELSLMNPTTVPWSATTVVMILGLGMFSFQLTLLS